ncbi:MAG: hypothetical protein KAX18_08580 [Candidatus Lokiarchaeota archaeon]|nr:hypothetical protein [Candidatus Lokiarchaeota archaeon]
MISNLNLIIIDSNFILLSFQFKVDYFNEIRTKVVGKLRFLIYKQVLDELEAKRKREARTTKFIRLLDSGLLHLEKNKANFDIEYVEEVKEEIETTDDFLLRKSLELKKEGQSIYIATNDSELRKKAKRSKISTIFLRQKKYLSIERA